MKFFCLIYPIIVSTHSHRVLITKYSITPYQKIARAFLKNFFTFHRLAGRYLQTLSGPFSCTLLQNLSLPLYRHPCHVHIFSENQSLISRILLPPPDAVTNNPGNKVHPSPPDTLHGDDRLSLQIPVKYNLS